MASSLRTRLWLTYAFVICTLLLVVASGVVITLQSSPLLYRQVVLKLRLAESILTPRLESNFDLQKERLEALIQREADNRQVRILLLNQDGTQVLDTGGNKNAPFPKLPSPFKANGTDPLNISTIRDSIKTTWFYLLSPVGENHYLIVAAQRPNIPIRQVLKDEVLSPFIQAGIIALAMAFLIAFLMAKWISSPLQNMAAAARQIAEGAYVVMSPEGPKEVQELAEAFNHMSQRVQTSSQSQRDFVANVSHELKTPLTSIQGFAQAILDGAAQTPEALHQAATVIFTEAGRMNRLVLDLLSLARLEGGTADLHHAPVDLNQLLTSVVEKFSLQAKQSGVVLVSSIKPLPIILGDGDRLVQVFSNLIDNALKYTTSGGIVTITGEARSSDLYIRIMDTGPGIPRLEHERIFERFYQVDKSRKGGRGRGIGLGLPIARQIVLAHAGAIWVEDSPKSGSTFIVRLPIVSSEDGAAKQQKG